MSTDIDVLEAFFRLNEPNGWAGRRFADGFEFRDGKIVRYLTFAERPEACEWAGVEDPAAT